MCVFVENVLMFTSNGISSYVEGIRILVLERQGKKNVICCLISSDELYVNRMNDVIHVFLPYSNRTNLTRQALDIR